MEFILFIDMFKADYFAGVFVHCHYFSILISFTALFKDEILVGA